MPIGSGNTQGAHRIASQEVASLADTSTGVGFLGVASQATVPTKLKKVKLQ